jgi:hypothetical protein
VGPHAPRMARAVFEGRWLLKDTTIIMAMPKTGV